MVWVAKTASDAFKAVMVKASSETPVFVFSFKAVMFKITVTVFADPKVGDNIP